MSLVKRTLFPEYDLKIYSGSDNTVINLSSWVRCCTRENEYYLTLVSVEYTFKDADKREDAMLSCFDALIRDCYIRTTLPIVNPKELTNVDGVPSFFFDDSQATEIVRVSRDFLFNNYHPSNEKIRIH